MRTMAVTTCVCVAAAGGFVLGGTERSENYDQPVARVFSAMQRTGVPQGMSAGFLKAGSVTVERGSGYSIEWKFRRDNRYIGALIATAEANGPAETSVTIVFEPGAANSKDSMIADGQVYATSVGLPVMFEYMDARIEGRAPDARILREATSAYISTHRDAIGRETQQIFSEVSKSMKEASEGANDGPISTYEATKPSLDLSDPNDARPSAY